MPDALASASIAALRAGVVRNSIRAMRGSTALRRTPPLRRPGSWITAGASRAGAGSVIARAADFMTTRMQVHGAAPAGGCRGAQALTCGASRNGGPAGATPSWQATCVHKLWLARAEREFFRDISSINGRWELRRDDATN